MRTVSDSVAEGITTQFIAENPSIVSVIRRTRTTNTAGGYTWTNPITQDPQTLRLVPHGKSLGERLVTTDSNGKEVVPTWLLVGHMDANLERFDLFTLDGDEYEILSVGGKPLMQRIIAEVVEYGG